MSTGDFAPPGAPLFPDGPPTGPPEPTPPQRRRRPFFEAGLALLIALLVAGVAALAIDTEATVVADAASDTAGGGDDPDPTPTDPTPTDPTPTDPTPTDPPPTGDDESFEAVIDELIAFVEGARGLEFKERPDVMALDEEAFVARYLDLVEEGLSEDPESIEHFDGIYHALGLLADDMSLAEATTAFGAEGVLGYYAFETDELVVRGAELTPYTRQVVVHELVHALDDQWFELDRPEYDDALDEVGFGFRSIVEGNAQRIDEEYYDSLPVSEQAAIDSEQLSFGFDIDFSDFTQGFLELQFAPYELGERFVASTIDRGGDEALAEAFAEPPRTSEQLIRPEAYVAGEGAIEVPAPPTDGDLVEEGIFGQLIIEVLLADAVGRSVAFDAGDGWGGDWFVTWERDADTCLRVDMVGDTDRDTDQLASSFAAWAVERPDATSELVDGRVRVTTCG